MTTITEPTDQQVVEACRSFKTREDIEAAGYVPGWHGEPVNVGDLAVIHGHNGWRQAIVTKVTSTYVHGKFTTPGAITSAEATRTSSLAIDPLKARSQTRQQELKNYDWYAYVAAGQPGDQWSPDPSYRNSTIRLTEEVIENGKRWLVGKGTREEYADNLADIAAERAMGAIRRAQSSTVADYANITNGKGDRTGKRTNLYVLPR